MRLLIILPLIAVLACGNPTQKADNSLPKSNIDTTDSAVTPKSELQANQALTNFARFIAGMKSSYKSCDSGSWKNYSSQNTEKWKVLQDKIGSKINTWVKETALTQKNEPKTLFYPFAGGDFYYANLFFPNQDTIIMMGLEPCGSIFNPDKKAESTMKTYYANLQHTMFFPHRLGFFRTKSMAVDFNQGPLNGTLHTVLFYMARAGFDIHYITHFNVDKDGKETDVLQAGSPYSARKAYKIGFASPGSNAVKELIYFSYDVSDGNMAKNPHLMNWMNKRGNVVAFFKAATYLMQYSTFSTMRNWVTKRATRVLQDDSGLPYKHLLANGYNVTLYGVFKRTIPLFEEEFQPDLKEAYDKTKPAILPFNIGYNAQFNECNLQHAIKK